MTEVPSSAIGTREVSHEDLGKLAAGGHLYAIADACNVPAAPLKAFELGPKQALSLYEGTAEQDFWDVAPYLFRVSADLLPWLIKRASNEGWGILIASKADIGTLRRHFRHFLKIQEPGGSAWSFRFYDPRTLEIFLLSCSEQQLRSFFGPVTAFGVLGPNATHTVFFRQQEGTTVKTTVADHQFLFRLRPEQLAAFESLVEKDFVRRLTDYLREDHGSVVKNLSAEVLAERVACGLRRARSYGLTTEANLATFVGLMFEVSPVFHEQEKIRSVLNDRSMDPDTRMDALFRLTSDQDWDEADQPNTFECWDALVKTEQVNGKTSG